MEINRRYSFRGRTRGGYCFWKKDGIENISVLNLNVLWNTFKEMGFTQEEIELVYILAFASIDFHEWLHIFIHRESRIEKRHHTSDGCEDFVRKSHEVLLEYI